MIGRVPFAVTVVVVGLITGCATLDTLDFEDEFRVDNSPPQTPRERGLVVELYDHQLSSSTFTVSQVEEFNLESADRYRRVRLRDLNGRVISDNGWFFARTEDNLRPGEKVTLKAVKVFYNRNLWHSLHLKAVPVEAAE